MQPCSPTRTIVRALTVANRSRATLLPSTVGPYGLFNRTTKRAFCLLAPSPRGQRGLHSAAATAQSHGTPVRPPMLISPRLRTTSFSEWCYTQQSLETVLLFSSRVPSRDTAQDERWAALEAQLSSLQAKVRELETSIRKAPPPSTRKQEPGAGDSAGATW